MRETLIIWASFWRDLMLFASGSAAHATNSDRLVEIENLAANLDLDIIFHFIQSLEDTLKMLERNVNQRLACEVLMLKLPRLTTLNETQG
jgi:DNA polymerase-3 subunit delta'